LTALLLQLRTVLAAQPDADLPALLDAADPGAARASRHLWLIALVDALRPADTATGDTAVPLERLRHLLDLLDTDPLLAQRCRALLRSVFATADAGTLLADFGFSPRSGFGAELIDRLRMVTLPGTPDTGDLGQLFLMVFHHPGDADWLGAEACAASSACWWTTTSAGTGTGR
jgi:site-specific recombinase